MSVNVSVSQPIVEKKVKTSPVKLWGGIAGVVVGLLLCVLPLPLETLGKVTLGLSVWMLVWFIVAPIPQAYTALIYLTAQVLLGYPSGTVFAMFTMSAGWFLVAAFVFAAAMMRSGLAKRLAYVIMYKLHGNTVPSFLLASVIICFVMVLLIPSPIAMVGVLLPILGYVAEEWGLPARGEEKKTPILAVLAVFLVLVGMMSGFWVKTGFSQNLVSLLLSKIDIEWGEWMKIAGPTMFVTALAFVGLLILIFKPSKSIVAPMEVLKVKVEELGSMSAIEKKVLAIMVVIFVGFVTESAHHIPTGWVALIGVILFALPRVGAFKNFEEVLGSVNWGLMIFTAALYALSVSFNQSGVTAMLVNAIKGLQPTTTLGFYALSSFFGTFVTGLVSLNVAQAVLCPLFTSWGTALGLSTAKSFLAIWLPAGSIGPNVLSTVLPQFLFAWVFKYKGEKFFTFKDAAICSLILYLAWFVIGTLFEMVVWPLI